MPAGSPPDAALEKSLRRVVAQDWETGNVSVNYARKASEKNLGLTEDFYVDHPRWKAESKRIIKDEVDKQSQLKERKEAQFEARTKAAPTPSPKAPAQDLSPQTKRPITDEEDGPRKRKKPSTVSYDEELSSLPSDLSSAEEKLKKKVGRKSIGSGAAKSGKQVVPKPAVKAKPKQPKREAEPHDESSGSDSEDAEKAPPPKPKKPKKSLPVPRPKPTDESESELSELVDDEAPKPKSRKNGDASEKRTVTKPKKSPSKPTPATKADDSESELSELIDEDPKPKRRKSREGSVKKAEKVKNSKPKPDTDEDPDTAEIKKLQGWLIKCGIRKLWGKELKPYETPKAKIRHLRDMLTEAGMTGRYSQEKANQIKEQRELAADIEAVQEGAERWGKDDEGSDTEEKDRPARRLVRGAKVYDFLSSDGEETD